MIGTRINADERGFLVLFEPLLVLKVANSLFESAFIRGNPRANILTFFLVSFAIQGKVRYIVYRFP